MSSNLLTKMGLGNLDLGALVLILLVLVLVLIGIVVWQMLKLNHLDERYQKFMQGGKAKSLEKQIQDLIKAVDDLQGASLDQGQDIKVLYQKMEGTFQKMGLIKYDAYKEMGGKLSYGLAVLDEKNNGFIINSVHSSSGCYSYTKRIRKGKCNIELSPEEKEALTRAMVGGNSKSSDEK